MNVCKQQITNHGNIFQNQTHLEIAMESKSETTTPTGAMPSVSKNLVFSLIDSFFKKLSVEQWRLLTAGTPDVGTKMLLAGLLLDIVDTVTEELAFNINEGDGVMSEKDVEACLGDTISWSFSEVLQIEEEVQCVSSQKLTELVVEEVTQEVNSITSPSETRQRNGTLERLKVMVSHGCQMLNNMIKRKHGSTILDKQSETSTGTASPITVERLSPEKIFSENSFVLATSRAVQQIIRKEVNSVTEPLLKSDVDSDILSKHSLETDDVAEDVVQSIVDDVEPEKPVSPAPKSEEESKQVLNNIGIKLKTLFAKQTSKALLLRLVGQLKARFYPDSEVDNSESVQSVIDRIDSLLEEGEGCADQSGQEVCPYQILENLNSDRVLVFRKELNELLYQHITDALAPEVLLTKAGNVTAIRVLPSKSNLRKNIDSKVWGFLLLMSYWLKFQSHSQSLRVAHALVDAKSDAISFVIEARKAMQDDGRRGAVHMFVRKLVSRTYKKAKLSCVATDPNETIEALFEKVWSAVKDIDFSPDALEDLDSGAYKKLRKVKKRDCAERVLASMWVGDSDIEECLISYVKDRLTKPAKRSWFKYMCIAGKTLGCLQIAAWVVCFFIMVL